MKFFDFEKKMRNCPIFSTSEAKVFFFDQKNISVQIAFWVKKGYLIKIKKGLYALANSKSDIDPIWLAGKIYNPSYLSLEFALNYYGIIPDIPGTYTSISSKKTFYFSSDFGNFSYQKIKPELFVGYKMISKDNFSFGIAVPEKALLDYLYFNKNKLVPQNDFWREMRINPDFKFNKKVLKFYEKLFNDKKISQLVLSVLSYQENDR